MSDITTKLVRVMVRQLLADVHLDLSAQEMEARMQRAGLAELTEQERTMPERALKLLIAKAVCAAADEVRSVGAGTA